MKKVLFFIPLFTFSFYFSQIKDIQAIDSTEISGTIEKVDAYSRNPTKAALYSAILPGLGQYYNKKYWKIPIALGLIGGSIYAINFYSGELSRFKTAYIEKLNGQASEFPTLSKERLAAAMDEQRRNRDYAVVFTVLFYALNILDATVDAHLSPFENDKDLSFEPILLQNPVTSENKIGLSLSYKF